MNLREGKELESKAAQMAQSMGLRFYSLDWNQQTLRIFLDGKEGKSVTLDDCSNFSRAFELVLDAEPDRYFDLAYRLEVSSAGLERPLIEEWHFSECVGKKISIKTFQNKEVNGVKSKTFLGTLKSFEPPHLEVDIDGAGVLNLNKAEVSKAKLIVFEN